jgi:UDP-glucose:(heptosyl)LPS alpha-1,3-glucosyltransferase
MKIAVLIRRFITTGGAERYAVEVTKRLAKAHEVHVLAQEWDHEPDGVKLHRVPLVSVKPHAFNQWWFSSHTARIARQLGVDIIHTHERVAHFNVMNIHSGTFAGGLWGTHSGERKSAFRTWLKILTAPSVWTYMRLEKLHNSPARGRIWVADSEMVKREVQHYYPIPDERFCIAHSGVDPVEPDVATRRAQWREKLGFRPEQVVALFVGSEFRRKGLPTLLEAMALLKEKAPHLVIVGGKDLESYQQRASELGINQRLTWAGRVSNVKDYYALADVFVLPTLSDPSPLAPLEAMAYGSAAIVSSGKYTGAAELIGNGEALILDDPRNAAEIARAMERLLDTQTRQELARRGQELVRELSWDRTAAVILQALEKSYRELSSKHTTGGNP